MSSSNSLQHRVEAEKLHFYKAQSFSSSKRPFSDKLSRTCQSIFLDQVKFISLISLLVAGLFAQFVGHSNYAAVFTPALFSQNKHDADNCLEPLRGCSHNAGGLIQSPASNLAIVKP